MKQTECEEGLNPLNKGHMAGGAVKARTGARDGTFQRGMSADVIPTASLHSARLHWQPWRACLPTEPITSIMSYIFGQQMTALLTDKNVL